MGKAARRKWERRAASASGRLEILVSLAGADPAIERRILLREGASLADLHHTIQAAMGWYDYHLHEFAAANGDRYGDPGILEQPGVKDEARTRAIELLAKPGDRIEYLYDFGDHWIHRIKFVAFREGSGPRIRYSACIGGRGACPPEDCGGMGVYRRWLAVLADPNHPDFAELRDWVEEMDRYPLDPHAFNLAEADQAVRGAS